MKSIRDAKAVYDAIELPPELGETIRVAARSAGRKPRHAQAFARYAACAAAVCLVLLVTALNTLPAVASGLSEIPVSGRLAQVQPNHYLPIVPTNAASAAMLPWQAPASPITSEVDGNCVRPTNRRQSGSEDRSKSNRLDTKNSRHSIPQAAQLFKRPTANAGVEGDSPRLSLGDQKGVFSSEREYPLLFAPLHGAGIYHPAWCRRNLISLPEPSA